MAEQQILPGIDAAKPYSFPTMTMSFKNYKIFGLVTNMDWAGDDATRKQILVDNPARLYGFPL